MDWFPDDLEVQGVTNDGANWYFTVVNQSTPPTEAYLWRIPKGVPLDGNVVGKPGVKMTKFSEVAELNMSGHVHWGDLDHVLFEGVDYLLIPIYSVVACFRAADLKYLNYANFDGNVSGGWCAVGADMGLYASANDPTSIIRYEVDWKKLVSTKEHDNVLTNPQAFPMTKSDGSPLYMTDMQGGEFTPSGEMLYLVSGRGACLEWLGIPGAAWSPRDGIHAIATENWREIGQSVKSAGPNDHFSYKYDPTCIVCTILGAPVGGGTDTPEGLTFWDLEDGSAPGIRGSLHVLHDRYLFGSTNCDDALFLHHYSTKLFVDHNTLGGPGLQGRIDHPFKTFPDAINYYPIWDGAHIILRTGEYPTGGITLNKRLLITSEGGASTIR